MRLYGYEVPEMTMVISSLGSYFDANMALLNAEVRQQLFLSSKTLLCLLHPFLLGGSLLSGGFRQCLLGSTIRRQPDNLRLCLGQRIPGAVQIEPQLIGFRLQPLPGSPLTLLLCGQGFDLRPQGIQLIAKPFGDDRGTVNVFRNGDPSQQGTEYSLVFCVTGSQFRRQCHKSLHTG